MDGFHLGDVVGDMALVGVQPVIHRDHAVLRMVALTRPDLFWSGLNQIIAQLAQPAKERQRILRVLIEIIQLPPQRISS